MQTKKPTLKQRYQAISNRALVIGTPVILATSAHAEGIDTSSAATQLGYALVAIGAIGAVKLAPAALTWVWSIVTRTASRG